MLIPNIVTKLLHFETVVKCLTCRLLTPAAWKVLTEDGGRIFAWSIIIINLQKILGHYLLLYQGAISNPTDDA